MNEVPYSVAVIGVRVLWYRSLILGCGLLTRFALNLSHAVDCMSPGSRRWPDDLAWHPLGEKLFAVYTADGGGPQVAIINTSKKVSTIHELSSCGM